MSSGDRSNDVAPDNGLLAEGELLAIYMKEAGPETHRFYVTSQVSKTVADALQDSRSEELHKGLELIELMGKELELDFDPNSPIRDNRSKAETLCSRRSSGKNDIFSLDNGVVLGSAGCESDIDSLMECGGALTSDFNSSLSSPGGLAVKFDLLHILDSIQERHISISSGFQSAQMRLEKLREQNRHDSIFLGKLSTSNEHMGDRIHEMKTDVLCLFSELDLIKNGDGNELELGLGTHEPPNLPKFQFQVEPELAFSKSSQLETPLSINFTEMINDRSVSDNQSVRSEIFEKEDQTLDQRDITTPQELSTPESEWKNVAMVPVAHVKKKFSGDPGSVPTNNLQIPLGTFPDLSASVSMLLVCLLGWWIAFKWN